MNHCPSEQLRCRSGVHRVLCLRVQGARSPMEKMMNLLWMTCNLISLILTFLAVSFLREHPPTILQQGREQIFPQENKITLGGLAGEGAGLHNLEIHSSSSRKCSVICKHGGKQDTNQIFVRPGTGALGGLRFSRRYLYFLIKMRSELRLSRGPSGCPPCLLPFQ